MPRFTLTKVTTTSEEPGSAQKREVSLNKHTAVMRSGTTLVAMIR